MTPSELKIKETAEQIVGKYKKELPYCEVNAKSCAILHCQGIIDELHDQVIGIDEEGRIMVTDNFRKYFWGNQFSGKTRKIVCIRGVATYASASASRRGVAFDLGICAMVVRSVSARLVACALPPGERRVCLRHALVGRC